MVLSSTVGAVRVPWWEAFVYVMFTLNLERLLFSLWNNLRKIAGGDPSSGRLKFSSNPQYRQK